MSAQIVKKTTKRKNTDTPVKDIDFPPVDELIEKYEKAVKELTPPPASPADTSNKPNIDVEEEIRKLGDELIFPADTEKKKTTYTEAHKRAQQRYREKYPEKYCESQRKLYERKIQDEEWRQKFNERSRKNNKAYREKKKQALLEQGIEIKSRGRPRKVVEEKE